VLVKSKFIYTEGKVLTMFPHLVGASKIAFCYFCCTNVQERRIKSKMTLPLTLNAQVASESHSPKQT
jgi:hypothetical protein